MEQTNTTTTRPTFLTVLCILTWIGSGLGLISAIWGVFVGNAVAELGGGENLATLQYANLACVVLCLIGAIMMWQMKKTGFYIYAVGELAPIILSFAILGEMGAATGLGGAMAAAGAIAAIFPIAFVVMYALNLKHMK